MNTIERIKYKRFSPAEKFLYDILIKVELRPLVKYPKIIAFLLNDELLFEYDSKDKTLWCKQDKIWNILEYNYLLDYSAIRLSINKVMFNIFKVSALRIHNVFAFDPKVSISELPIDVMIFMDVFMSESKEDNSIAKMCINI